MKKIFLSLVTIITICLSLSSCNLFQKGTEGLEYTLLDDGTYEVSGVGEAKNESEIIIPSTYNGKPVTSIGEKAFLCNEKIRKIVMPNSITNIGKEAFSHCEEMESIKISSNLTTIGEGAFLRCISLEKIEIPNSVISIGAGAFIDCGSRNCYNEYNNAYYLGNKNNPYLVLAVAKDTEISSCIINENTKFIHTSAFSYCSNLQSIKIPDSVISIESGAFTCCSNLTNIVIPDSVEIIGGNAFNYCDKLAIYCEAINEPDTWDSYWRGFGAVTYWYSENEPTEDGNYWHYVNGEVTIWE